MIGVTGHFERAKVKKIAKSLFGLLEKEGFEVELFKISSKKLCCKEFELVCVVGGDGSLLRVAREAIPGTPLIGIAAGKRSYLMQVNPNRIGQMVKKIADGKYVIEKRARLKARLGGKKLPMALNEYLVAPKKSGRLIECEIKYGQKNEKIACDGLIIATATGSSGHSYSAGGRKIREQEQKTIIVPSNPLNRQWKPFTVSNRSKITIKGIGRETSTEVVADGRERFPMDKKLVIEKGEPILVMKLEGLQ
tara:strand:- start:621 stop:1370 length:750 start_codon:yes stop_codon:yes gene_type:complete